MDMPEANDRNPEPDGGIRASDAERERTAEALKRHALDGRLTSDEYAERLDAAYAARTRAQLDRLLDDLPPMRRPAPAGATPPRWRGINPVAVVILLIAALWLAGWVFGGPHHHGFVPVWPLVIWGVILLRWRAWRVRPRR